MNTNIPDLMTKDYTLKVTDVISFNSTTEVRMVLFNGDEIGRIETNRKTDKSTFISQPIEREGIERIAGKVDDKLATKIFVVAEPQGRYLLSMKYKSVFAHSFLVLARLLYSEIQLQDLPF